MSEIAPVNGDMIPQRIGPGHAPREHGVATIAAPAQDEVEISSVAQALSLLENAPDIRVDKVAEVRAAIARGDYETDERIDRTIDRLMVDVYA
ncbi:MAG TPA: flagellar biosynthesis anti-sigma factor FlgM [Phycisphaerae bacterium]|nr:flagellar biosynthesis anti-sigma factor FlgM [Phycisphaerae bacterium]